MSAAIEVRFTRKKWEHVMLVKDGDSMLVFVDNGREQSHHDLEFLNIEQCDAEWDRAHELLAEKGFTEDVNSPAPVEEDNPYGF